MNYYDHIAQGYDELHGEEQLKKLALIKNKLDELDFKINKNTKLLDVGCGTGISTDFWDCDATGIDPSERLLKQNKKGKSKLIHAKAEKIPFPDNSFDIVISVTAIQNFKDIKKGLDEIKRVGKDMFALSFLKKSEKSGKIKNLIEEKYNIIDIIEEEKDIIIFAG